MDEATVHTWLDTDYYEILGVPRDAERSEIAKAYRRHARALHPDTAGHEADANTFAQVQAAFDVLGHDEVRAQYDEVHRIAEHFLTLAQRKAEVDEADAWIPAYTTRLQMQFSAPTVVNPWRAFMPWNPWLAPGTR